MYDGALPYIRLYRRRPLVAHRPTLARHSIRPMDVFSANWLGICRRVVTAQRAVFAGTARSDARTVYEGVGGGGDRTPAIDRRCEGAVSPALGALAAQGGPLGDRSA